MSSVGNKNRTNSSNSRNAAADSQDDNDVTRFREQYFYQSKSNSKIVIFGLQDGCGLKLFNEFFNGEHEEEYPSKYDENVKIKGKVLPSFSEKEQCEVLVNPSQSNTHLLTWTAYGTLGKLAKEPSRFVVVFDAALHRFSSDCEEALRLLEKCFGPDIWLCTTLIIVNADKVFENTTTEGYFKEEKDSLMGRWASKMGNGVLALPSSDKEFSKGFHEKRSFISLKYIAFILQPKYLS